MLADLSILDLVPALRPDWRSPYHLSDWCECIEGAILGGARALCSEPFQHYKSCTTNVGIVWLLLRRPQTHVVYLTHSHEKAQAESQNLRELWKLAGGKFRDGFNKIGDWQTPEGGGCVAMSAQQSKLGYPCDVLLVDDPLDETEYMVDEVRRKVDETIGFYTARAATHLNSILIVASRWHPDDPIGLRLQRKAVTWREINHPGIVGYSDPPEGVPIMTHLERVGASAFAPEVLDLVRHVQMRAEWEELDPSLRKWWAQVQNNPLPDATGFFAGERLYID